MDIETLGTVAYAATVLAWAMGATVSLAILGAIVEALWPGAQARLGAWVVEALSVALRALCLAGLAFMTLPDVFAQVAVTFLHTYRADRATMRPEADGRHAAGFGRMRQPAGRHRMA